MKIKIFDIIFMIFLLIFIFRLFFALQTPYFSDDYSYYADRQISNIMDTGKHITYENILSSIPRHEIGNLKEVVNDLLKNKFLVWYDRSRKAIQLNKDKLNEIREYLMED